MSQPGAGWRIDKSINPGNALALIAMVATGFAQVASVDKRISVLEVRAESQVKIDAAQDAAAERVRQEVRGDLREINNKLDKLVERQNK